MTIIFKNILSKEYNDRKKFIKNKSICKIYLNKILKELDFKKDVFSSFSKNYKLSFDYKKLSKYKKFKNVVIIGMGGSILGSQAIYSLMKDKIKKNFLFIDNLNELNKFNFEKNKNPLFIFISKSGNTLETIVNINCIKRKLITKKNTIIISSNNNNSLTSFSKKNQIPLITHKSFIGGRYSVFSEVGLFPISLMGLKIKEFKKNILSYFYGKKRDFLIETCSRISQLYLSKNINNLIFLSYYPQLDKFLFWCQQLIAESLGKKGIGLLPVISQAPKDHHSLLQLYLDGPKDKIFYVISSVQKKGPKIPFNHFGKDFNHLKNKQLEKVVIAQKNALTKIFRKKNIPYREIIIKQKNEKMIGELFSYFILETVLIGKILNINPFNQPSVESVKIETKKNLI